LIASGLLHLHNKVGCAIEIEIENIGHSNYAAQPSGRLIFELAIALIEQQMNRRRSSHGPVPRQ